MYRPFMVVRFVPVPGVGRYSRRDSVELDRLSHLFRFPCYFVSILALGDASVLCE